MKRLCWNEFRGRLWSRDSAFLLNRVRLPDPEREGPGMHDHDFAELFWVTCGQGSQQTSAGGGGLSVGMLYGVRPEHAHEIRGRARSPLEFFNLAFPGVYLENLEALFPEVAHRLWGDGGAPLCHRISPALLEWLEGEARTLAAGSHGRAALFHFLLGLFIRMQPVADTPFGESAPIWLRDAYRKFREPGNFAGGVRRLAELAGRTPETVSRVVKGETGETAASLVNRLRMEHAARELRITHRPLLDILFECGFQGTSQFYRRFREAYGMSPGAYRRQFARIA